MAILVVQSQSLDVALRCHRSVSPVDGLNCEAKNAQPLHTGEQINLICAGAEECNGKLDEVTFIAFNGSHLNWFPSEIFQQVPSLIELLLENKGLEAFTKDHLTAATKLRKLNLSTNTIRKIPANVISLAPVLQTLYLYENRIESIEDGAFNSSTLELLILTRNRLTSLKRGMFSGAPNLLNLRLGLNLIETIEDGTFDLPNLQNIDLKFNRLRALPSNFAPNAVKLTLNNNHLSEILSVIEKAPNLKFLNLNNNPALKEQILPQLRRLPELITLQLDNTNISMPMDVPSHKLKYLWLRNNHLSDSGLLNQLKRLTDLDMLRINNNQFTKLDDFDKIQKYFPGLNFLDADGNKWDCDWVKSNRIFWLAFSIPSCSGVSDENSPDKGLEY